MAKMVIDDTPDHDDGGHRPSTDAAWTAEQTVYALFLKAACVRLEAIAKAACVRLEAIAVEIGIESHLVDRFVRDALFTIHHARHTLARGRQADAWIEAIARNLARTLRYGAASRGRRSALFWSLRLFARVRRHRGGYAEARRPTADVRGEAVATTM